MTAQPRERACACQVCRADTWNTDAVCDGCKQSVASAETLRRAAELLRAHTVASTFPKTFRLALADMLDLAASHKALRGDDCGQGFHPVSGRYGYIDPSCAACGTPDEYAEPWPCETARLALAVARAYLGESA